MKPKLPNGDVISASSPNAYPTEEHGSEPGSDVAQELQDIVRRELRRIMEVSCNNYA